MEIIDRKINELKAYEKNPRKNDDAVKYVANSIREFGFKVPVVIDKDNTIVAGHTRIKAAKKLGMKTVPCIVADDLTEEQIKAFRLADNKVGEIAKWDDDLLAEELEEIPDIDMEEFGFELPAEEEIIEPEEKELTPYQKVQYLITADINRNDLILEALSTLDGAEGIEIVSTAKE